MDPIEMAAAGQQMLGGLFHGITGYVSGNEQADAYRMAADRAKNEAGVAAGEDLEKGDETAARAATQAAANGGGLVGSSLGVVAQASRNAYFNARADSYRGLTAASADLYDAKIASQNATNALIGGLFGGASSGASDVIRFDARDQLSGLY